MVKIHSAIYTRMAMNITHAHTRSSIVYNKVLRSEPHTHTLPPSPAADGGLQQCGDAHAEENGADELTCSPLVESHTHGFGQQERHSDRPTEAR